MGGATRAGGTSGGDPGGPELRMGAITTYASAATSADAGIVSTHAITMFPATPQRTAESRSLAPTPMIALEITCVVDTGIPKWEAV